MPAIKINVGIVIVTYNRKKDLIVALDAYEKQTVEPSYVLVVNNNSNDGTKEFLEKWEKETSSFEHKVINLNSNVGGSGGFAKGMEEAVKTNCEWIFLADDDAVPAYDMLEKLQTFINNNPEEIKKISALCTSVDNNGKRQGIHRCRIKNDILGRIETHIKEIEYSKATFEVDIYSFVGIMIKRKIVEQVGPAIKDFFIYQDDYEHAERVRKTGKIICVTSSIMYHVDNYVPTKEATWRDYYATRNAVWVHLHHYGRVAGFSRAIRRILAILKCFSFKKLKVLIEGIKDAYKNKLGINPKYMPGKKIE